MQIGLAVGDTNEEKKKAEFTKIEVQVRGSLFVCAFSLPI